MDKEERWASQECLKPVMVVLEKKIRKVVVGGHGGLTGVASREEGQIMGEKDSRWTVVEMMSRGWPIMMASSSKEGDSVQQDGTEDGQLWVVSQVGPRGRRWLGPVTGTEMEVGDISGFMAMRCSINNVEEEEEARGGRWSMKEGCGLRIMAAMDHLIFL